MRALNLTYLHRYTGNITNNYTPLYMSALQINIDTNSFGRQNGFHCGINLNPCQTAHRREDITMHSVKREGPDAVEQCQHTSLHGDSDCRYMYYIVNIIIKFNMTCRLWLVSEKCFIELCLFETSGTTAAQIRD